jgi:hypothetical protein
MATHKDGVGGQATHGFKVKDVEAMDGVLAGVAYIGAGLAVATMPSLVGGILVATGLFKLSGVVMDRWF